MRRRAAVLCGAAVVAAMVTAPPPAAGASTAPHTTALTWRKCGTDRAPGLQCSSVRVPLDHTDPHGRLITLALSRVPHTAKTYQGPLLVNPGGPGGSGLSLAGVVAASLPEKVAAQYDVIGFDPRGVGRSKPALDCVPGHFGPVRPASVPDGRDAERANAERARRFAEACGEKYADLLPYMDTVSTVRDMDVIRAAVGAPELSYFGYSYGTYLGAVYGKLFPGRVRRMVLDSVVDPTGVWYRDNFRQNLAFDARHRAFLAWVAKHDEVYGLGRDPARVEAEWYGMRAAVTRRPAGGKVGGAELEDTFLPGGYYNGYWPRLAEAFAAYVKDHDAGPLVAAHAVLGSSDASDDNGYSVYTAVQCRDSRWPRAGHVWAHDTRVSHHHAPFTSWNNTWYNAPCAHWPTRRLIPPDVRNSSLPPVLLFQATDDGATPYEGGVAVHHLLRGSSLVVERGGGNHGITLSGNRCLDDRLAAYLESGEVPRGTGEADAVCEKLPDPGPDSKGAGTRSAALHGMIGFRG